MPNRIIREGIIHSPVVNVLDAHEEVFYRRLLNVVDDYGRYPAHPAILRAACFPLRLDSIRESDVSRWTDKLSSPGLIVLYDARGQRFLQVCNFNQRQRTPSKYPEPPQGLVAEAEKRAGFLLAECSRNARGSPAQAYSNSEAKPNSNTETAATPAAASDGAAGLPPQPSEGAKALWRSAIEKLRDSTIQAESFAKWIAPLRLAGWEGGTVSVCSSNPYVARKAGEDFGKEILGSLQSVDPSVETIVYLERAPIVPGVRKAQSKTE